jgi:hypothetical protein
MTRRTILAPLVIALTVLMAPASVKADDPIGGGQPVYQVPPDGLGGAGGGGSNCFLNFAYCMDRASQLPSWWERWGAALDCELDLVACIRKAVL